MDEVLIRNALNSMLEATKDDATPIIRRLARVQARAALDTLASAPAGDGHGKWHPMLLDLVNAIHRDRGEKTQAIGIDLSYQQALAALARPRAAVGEREA